MAKSTRSRPRRWLAPCDRGASPGPTLRYCVTAALESRFASDGGTSTRHAQGQRPHVRGAGVGARCWSVIWKLAGRNRGVRGGVWVGFGPRCWAEWSRLQAPGEAGRATWGRYVA
eukprot:scaffold1146_cov399-Prasinococcus_capsulatus_cf.AAC.51